MSTIVLLCVLLGAAALSPGQEAAIGAIDGDRFASLSPVEQKRLIVSAFQVRLEHAANIEYEGIIRLGLYKYQDGALWRSN